MLQPGIYDNIIISKTAINDKGTLTIGVEKAKEEEAVEMDALAAFNSTADEEGSEGQLFMMWPPKNTDFQGADRTGEQVLEDFGILRSQLSHVLSQYMTTDKIVWDLTKGVKIEASNLAKRIVEEAVIEKVYANLAEQFVEQASSLIGLGSPRLRALFPRQSKNSEYIGFRKRFLSSNPIFESMDVPKDSSKLKFNKYEVSNSLNTTLAADAVKADDDNAATSAMDDFDV